MALAIWHEGGSEVALSHVPGWSLMGCRIEMPTLRSLSFEVHKIWVLGLQSDSAIGCSIGELGFMTAMAIKTTQNGTIFAHVSNTCRCPYSSPASRRASSGSNSSPRSTSAVTEPIAAATSPPSRYTSAFSRIPRHRHSRLAHQARSIATCSAAYARLPSRELLRRPRQLLGGPTVPLRRLRDPICHRPAHLFPQQPHFLVVPVRVSTRLAPFNSQDYTKHITIS
jgi:hypothetical protein